MVNVEDLVRRKSEITNKINPLLEELDAINVLLKIYDTEGKEDSLEESKNSSKENSELAERLKNASQPEQFLIILGYYKRFMKIREISKMLVDNIGGNEDDWTIKLSRVTGKLKKLNRIKSYKVGRSNTNVFWGSPNWIDNDGNIKKEFTYNESAIEKAGSSLLPNL